MAAVPGNRLSSGSPVPSISSHASPMTNIPSVPLYRIGMTASDSPVRQNILSKRLEGYTPYQWVMAIEPPLTLRPNNLQIAIENAQNALQSYTPSYSTYLRDSGFQRLERGYQQGYHQGYTREVRQTEAAGEKKAFCPYLKFKGSCKFSNYRCTYSHDYRLLEQTQLVAISHEKPSFRLAGACTSETRVENIASTLVANQDRDRTPTLMIENSVKDVLAVEVNSFAPAVTTREVPNSVDISASRSPTTAAKATAPRQVIALSPPIEAVRPLGTSTAVIIFGQDTIAAEDSIAVTPTITGSIRGSPSEQAFTGDLSPRSTSVQASRPASVLAPACLAVALIPKLDHLPALDSGFTCTPVSTSSPGSPAVAETSRLVSIAHEMGDQLQFRPHHLAIGPPSKENTVPNDNQGNGKGASDWEEAPAGQVYCPYKPIAHTKGQILRITDPQRVLTQQQLTVWDRGARRRVPRINIRELRFEATFGKVADDLLRKAINNDKLSRSVTLLSVADGSELTDEGLFDLSHRVKNLRVLILNGASRITDAAVVALCVNLRSLEYLEITGTRKCPGMLSSAVLRMMRRSPSVGAGLKEIILKNQAISAKEASALSMMRPTLALILSQGSSPMEEPKTIRWSAGESVPLDGA
ncbi:hypothetical protein TWF481_007734 [Arthrobotrys musiformis]|uniref:C3H1-type domain-containing protein n=1 Tax=Arthrobotrys musiformis TaxID=47236 RepID=A0AAV9WEL5_9PEZI